MFKGYDESLIRPIATVPITDEKDIAKLPSRLTGFETTPQKVCIAHRDEKDYSLIFDYTRPDISVDSGPEYLRDVAAATKSTLLTMQIFETMVQENSLPDDYLKSLLSYCVAYLETVHARTVEECATDNTSSDGVIFGITQTLVKCILDIVQVATRLTPVSVLIQVKQSGIRYPYSVDKIIVVTRDEGNFVYRRLILDRVL